MPNNKCPYCASELNPVPKRKKECPNCGKFILVRKGVLLTQDDADIHDWLVQFTASSIPVDRREFDVVRESLGQEFGKQATVNDTVWRILNRYRSEQSYYLMARLAQMENRDPRPFIVSAHKTALHRMRSDGVKLVHIANMNDSYVCDECKKLAGATFTIEQALKELPIPSRCSHECRCFYVEGPITS